MIRYPHVGVISVLRMQIHASEFFAPTLQPTVGLCAPDKRSITPSCLRSSAEAFAVRCDRAKPCQYPTQVSTPNICLHQVVSCAKHLGDALTYDSDWPNSRRLFVNGMLLPESLSNGIDEDLMGHKRARLRESPNQRGLRPETSIHVLRTMFNHAATANTVVQLYVPLA